MLPGIQITRPGHDDLVALNDVSVVRAGIGQIRVAIEVDGVLYGRIAGDGVIVATALGSSAYSLAAGGPLLAPGADGFVISPLPTHGGSVPPLVAGTASTVTLDVDGGYGGARLELDGQIVTGAPGWLTLRGTADVVSLVALAGGRRRSACCASGHRPRQPAGRRRTSTCEWPRELVPSATTDVLGRVRERVRCAVRDDRAAAPPSARGQTTSKTSS